MIAIELENSKTDYVPADLIRGTVKWSEMEPRATHLEARLIWYTVGKGTRDLAMIATEKIECAGQPNGQAHFEFTAPHRPYSVATSLLSITWAIELIQFPSQHSVSSKIVISANGQEVQLTKDMTEQAKSSAIISSASFNPKW